MRREQHGRHDNTETSWGSRVEPRQRPRKAPIAVNQLNLRDHSQIQFPNTLLQQVTGTKRHAPPPGLLISVTY
ncbi:unnamed protein product [Strongylus vulgaris]|uniref:Uncharacterized protein n=1 Tax=Strongylus vulgaris TaxID=40348 RepID=A0A3P7IPF7_STRVU|nr:unnamed protein product [Strongylus vulgaris]